MFLCKVVEDTRHLKSNDFGIGDWNCCITKVLANIVLPHIVLNATMVEAKSSRSGAKPTCTINPASKFKVQESHADVSMRR